MQKPIRIVVKDLASNADFTWTMNYDAEDKIAIQKAPDLKLLIDPTMYNASRQFQVYNPSGSLLGYGKLVNEAVTISSADVTKMKEMVAKLPFDLADEIYKYLHMIGHKIYK
jgi:hypothetical protein